MQDEHDMHWAEIHPADAIMMQSQEQTARAHPNEFHNWGRQEGSIKGVENAYRARDYPKLGSHSL